jgi:hypothetical protein
MRDRQHHNDNATNAHTTEARKELPNKKNCFFAKNTKNIWIIEKNVVPL